MRFWHSPALWFQVLFNLLSEPEKRRKLESVNTLEDVVRYLVSTNVFFWLDFHKLKRTVSYSNLVFSRISLTVFSSGWSDSILLSNSRPHRRRSLCVLWNPGLQIKGWGLCQVKLHFFSSWRLLTIFFRLAVDFPDLPDPQAMFDIHYFRFGNFLKMLLLPRLF